MEQIVKSMMMEQPLQLLCDAFGLQPQGSKSKHDPIRR